jgi:hypothetical protein
MLWYKSFTISIVEQMILVDLLDAKILPFLRKSASVRVVADSLEKVRFFLLLSFGFVSFFFSLSFSLVLFADAPQIIKALSQLLRDSKGVPRALNNLHDFVIGLIQRLMEQGTSGNSSSSSAQARERQAQCEKLAQRMLLLLKKLNDSNGIFN